MKSIFNFGTDNPLTLDMGHPLELRLRSLQHVDRNKKVLPATIGAALLITSAISSVSAKTNEIARDVAAPVMAVIDVAAESVDPYVMEITPVESPPVQIAQLRPKAIPVAQRVSSGLEPMRVRLTPRYTTAQLNRLTELRKREKAAQGGVHKAFNDEYLNVHYYNRFEVAVRRDGQVIMSLSTGSGGWPDYPANNLAKWDTRPLSADMKRGMQAIFDKCASQSSSVYFPAQLLDGDTDIGFGDFRVECTPGAEDVWIKTTRKDLAEAWFASEDISLAERQSNMGWRMSFALMEEYVASNVKHSIVADRAACVRMNETIKRNYTYTEADKVKMDGIISKCSETDYNWLRRRENLPEVQ